MDRVSEASEEEWYDLVDELANHYDEVNEQNARELLRSSHFGDHTDESQIQALVKDAKRKGESNE